MFQFKHDFEADFCGARDLSLARALNPRLQDFRTWLASEQGPDTHRVVRSARTQDRGERLIATPGTTLGHLARGSRKR